jgi:RNA polymerase sigma-70 factor (ECF subfamily)
MTGIRFAVSCNGGVDAGDKQMMREREQRGEAALARTERFESLFRSHHAAVVTYVRRRATADAVDDLVEETFLVAWRRLDKVPEQELPWLLGVARNVLATQRRGTRRREALAVRLAGARTPQHAPSTNDPPDARLAEALAKLPAKDREALLLTAWDDLTPAQAALVLGEPSGTFRVRLHRARRRLRRLLEEDARLPAPARDRTLRATEDCS